MNDAPVDNAMIWRTLESIPDPEFGISIVDLGLIYSAAANCSDVSVVMTLTTPMCPSGSWIHEGVRAALSQIPGLSNVTVDLVFDPPWNTGMLTANARRQLGWTVEMD